MDKPELIIFDCDGVLIDSEPVASRTLARALRAAGVAITAQEAHLAFTGNAESDIRRLCATAYGLTDVEETFARWHDELYEEFARTLRPMAGMVELVGALAAPKCVASNSTMVRLRASLGQTELWTSFAPYVFSAEAVASPKPAPDLLLHCAAAFGAQPRRCIMIDDSPHGIASARAAGMVAVGFVDPHDPRPGRLGVLEAAGADRVVEGAGALRRLLDIYLEHGVTTVPLKAVASQA